MSWEHRQSSFHHGTVIVGNVCKTDCSTIGIEHAIACIGVPRSRLADRSGIDQICYMVRECNFNVCRLIICLEREQHMAKRVAFLLVSMPVEGKGKACRPQSSCHIAEFERTHQVMVHIAKDA